MIMKFKKAYKEMNDEIHASRALLHSILNDSQENKPSFFESFFTFFSSVFGIFGDDGINYAGVRPLYN